MAFRWTVTAGVLECVAVTGLMCVVMIFTLNRSGAHGRKSELCKCESYTISTYYLDCYGTDFMLAS